MSNKLTLITPTSDRSVAFQLCERWMHRALDRFHGEVQWIVADDGLTPVTCTLGQEHLRREHTGDRKKSFLGNMLAALKRVRHEKVLFIEDDDWYASDYLNAMSRWLEEAEIVGEGRARYYQLSTRRYRLCQNDSHASLCQTGIRGELILWMAEHIARHNSTFIDIHVWKTGAKDRRRLLLPQTTLSVGIKGLPGTSGIGIGHRLGQKCRCDTDGSILRSWIPEEDVNAYFSIMNDSSSSTTVIPSQDFHFEIRMADFNTVSPLMKHRRREHDQFTTWFAAFYGETLIGCCALKRLRKNPSVALFFADFVKPEFRRRGVYRALMQYRKTWAQEHGVDTGVAQCNKTSLPTYERQGFEATKVWPDHQPVAADLRTQNSKFRIEDSSGVQSLRERFASGGEADREHGGKGGLGFGLTHYSLVRLHRPQHVLVIGSRHGFIPACIASALEANGAGHLDFVDANYSDRKHGFHVAWGGVGHWTAGGFETLSGVVTSHLQRSDEFFATPSTECHYDYVYLDGAHDFDSVKQDFEAAADRLNEQGMILLHDPLVRRKGFGVRKFVESLSPSQWRWIILPPWPGLAIVQRT